MPSVTFVLPDGTRRVLPMDGAATAMHLAVRHDLPGLPAECGGQLACATCLVAVSPEWAARVGPPGPDEADMIEDALGTRQDRQRLSCQIPLTPALDGLELLIPPAQR